MKSLHSFPVLRLVPSRSITNLQWMTEEKRKKIQICLMDNVNPRRRHHPSTCADFFFLGENLWNLFSFLCWITLIVCGLLHYSSEETWNSIRLIATSWLLDVEKNVECWHCAGLSGGKEKVEILPEDTERTIYVPEIYLWCGSLSPHFTCNAIAFSSDFSWSNQFEQFSMRWSSAGCSRRAANWTCYADEMTKFAHFFPWTFVCALHLHQQLKLFSSWCCNKENNFFLFETIIKTRRNFSHDTTRRCRITKKKQQAKLLCIRKNINAGKSTRKKTKFVDKLANIASNKYLRKCYLQARIKMKLKIMICFPSSRRVWLVKGKTCLICMETRIIFRHGFSARLCEIRSHRTHKVVWILRSEKSTSWVSRCWKNFEFWLTKKCKLFIVSRSCFPSSLTSPHTRHITQQQCDGANTTKHFPNLTFIHAQRARISGREMYKF